LGPLYRDGPLGPPALPGLPMASYAAVGVANINKRSSFMLLKVKLHLSPNFMFMHNARTCINSGLVASLCLTVTTYAELTIKRSRVRLPVG